MAIFRRVPPNGGVECRWIGKNRDSEPIIGFIACCERFGRQVASCWQSLVSGGVCFWRETRYWLLSAVHGCQPSVTELFRSPTVVSGTYGLAQHVTSAPSLAIFRSRFKTYLFKRCFPWLHRSLVVPENWHVIADTLIILSLTYLLTYYFVLQCYDTVGWVIWPVKSSPKWPIMCWVGR